MNSVTIHNSKFGDENGALLEMIFRMKISIYGDGVQNGARLELLLTKWGQTHRKPGIDNRSATFPLYSNTDRVFHHKVLNCSSTCIQYSLFLIIISLIIILVITTVALIIFTALSHNFGLHED